MLHLPNNFLITRLLSICSLIQCLFIYKERTKKDCRQSNSPVIFNVKNIIYTVPSTSAKYESLSSSSDVKLFITLFSYILGELSISTSVCETPKKNILITVHLEITSSKEIENSIPFCPVSVS